LRSRIYSSHARPVSGDLAILDDSGQVFIVGRKKDICTRTRLIVAWHPPVTVDL